MYTKKEAEELTNMITVREGLKNKYILELEERVKKHIVSGYYELYEHYTVEGGCPDYKERLLIENYFERLGYKVKYEYFDDLGYYITIKW